MTIPPLPLDMTGADRLMLRREDVAALVAGYRRQSRMIGALGPPSVTGIGGLLAATMLIVLGSHLGWPEVLGPRFLFWRMGNPSHLVRYGLAPGAPTFGPNTRSIARLVRSHF